MSVCLCNCGRDVPHKAFAIDSGGCASFPDSGGCVTFPIPRNFALKIERENGGYSRVIYQKNLVKFFTYFAPVKWFASYSANHV